MISLDENFIPCLSFRRAFVCFLFSKLAYKLIISIKKNKWELKFYQARESQMKLGRFFYIFFFYGLTHYNCPRDDVGSNQLASCLPPNGQHACMDNHVAFDHITKICFFFFFFFFFFFSH
jgi:hypothetical protein